MCLCVLCGENESHSWNVGPLSGCLHALSADLFLSLPKLRQTRVPTHIRSSPGPFLDKHGRGSPLKQGPQPLWFYVETMTICYLWECFIDDAEAESSERYFLSTVHVS